MIDPAVLKAMLEAGCTAEQIVAVVAADSSAETERAAARRERDRIRKRAQRQAGKSAISKVTSEMSHGQRGTAWDTADNPSPKEIPPTPPKEITPSQSEANASSKTPRGELARVLDDGRAKAVVDHRQRIRKPLTAHAANLLAGKFARCPDPNAAADTMIANGWQGFEPGWMDRPAVRGSPAPRREKTNIFEDLSGFMDDGQEHGNGDHQASGKAALSVSYRRTDG